MLFAMTLVLKAKRIVLALKTPLISLFSSESFRCLFPPFALVSVGVVVGCNIAARLSETSPPFA
jgi:hypothetical protein